MNDRFKFRVWHKDLKVIFYNVQDLYDPSSTDPESKLHADCFGHLLNREKLILMQSTCLKDKNDKLIYEGDIIINRRSPNSLASEYKWIVEFGEHETSSDYYASRAYGFYAKQIGFDDEASLVQIYDEIEILGNIYQNPELLEVSTKEQK